MIRKGFTMIELVIVLTILGVLASIGIRSGGLQLENARLKTAANNMQLIASDIEKAVLDLNFLSADDTEQTALRYFKQWDARYLSCPLNLDTMTFTPAGAASQYGTFYQGYLFRTNGYQDPWESEFRIYYLIPVEGDSYRIVIASAGPDGRFADAARSAYVDVSGTGIDYADDVLLIMEPRV